MNRSCYLIRHYFSPQTMTVRPVALRKQQQKLASINALDTNTKKRALFSYCNRKWHRVSVAGRGGGAVTPPPGPLRWRSRLTGALGRSHRMSVESPMRRGTRRLRSGGSRNPLLADDSCPTTWLNHGRGSMGTLRCVLNFSLWDAPVTA